MGRKRKPPPDNLAPGGWAKRPTEGAKHGLTSGRLPFGASYITRMCGRLERALEDDVRSRKGRITLYDVTLIQTAMRWEKHSQLAQRWLRMHLDDLSPDQRITFSKECALASERRDLALAKLGIAKGAVEVMSRSLYDIPVGDESSSDEPSEIDEKAPSSPSNGRKRMFGSQDT